MATNRNNLKGNPKPIDVDVVVPEAVRRAAAAADEAMKTAYPVDPNAAPPHVDPNAPAPPADETITIVEADPPKKLPEQVTKAPPLPAAPTPPSADDASWEAKYNSQLGRVRQLSKLSEELAARNEALEHMLAAAPTPQAPKSTPTPAQQKLITAQEEADFGPEMLDVMRRAAKEVASPEVDTLKAQMLELEARLNGTSQTLASDARGRMLATLDSALPEWHEINHLDEFKAWLALPDPFSGVMRKRLLTDAYEQNKTPQVLAFFKGFVSELAATHPAEAQNPPPPATPQPAKPTLASLAAPGRARTAASVGTPAEKQIIYTSDINAFYAAKRKGLYDGREAEFATAEKELQLAMQEGRVVTNT